MTCKCQCGEYPIGPSRAEAIRVAVEANNARWATAMEDVRDDMKRRADSCQTLVDVGGESPRVEGKCAAYDHASQMLHDAIARAKGTP